MVRFSRILLYSSGLIVYVGRSPPYLLGLGFHADADTAGTYLLSISYLFSACYLLPFILFFHTRKVSERDHA